MNYEFRGRCFSKEKPFRVVSCGFVDYRIPRRDVTPVASNQFGIRNSGNSGIEVFSKEKPFRVVSWNVSLGYSVVCGWGKAWKKRRRYFSAAPSLTFSFQFSTFNSISCVWHRKQPCLRGAINRCQEACCCSHSGRSLSHVWMAASAMCPTRYLFYSLHYNSYMRRSRHSERSSSIRK